jgi:hypothetical protein
MLILEITGGNGLSNGPDASPAIGASASFKPGSAGSLLIL